MFNTMIRIITFAGTQKKTVQAALVYNMAYSFCHVAPLFALLLALQAILLNTVSTATIGLTLGIMILGIIGKIILGRFASKYKMLASYSMCAEKRMQLGERFKRVPLGYFDTHRRGELTAILSTNMNEIEFLAMVVLEKLSSGIAYAAAMSISLFLLDWRVGLLYLAGLLCAYGVYSYIQKRAEKVAPARQKTQNAMIASILEYCKGIAVVRAFSTYSQTLTSVEKNIQSHSIATEELERTFVELGGVYQAIFKVFSCLMVAASCTLWLYGSISSSLCLLFILSSFMVYMHVENFGILSGMSRIVNLHLDAVDSLQTLPLLDEKGHSINPQRFDLAMENVSFSYGEKPLLQNITLHIPEGSTTAIVGPSGSGKSTLCRLLARFWDVQEGAVSLGGHNVKDFTCESLWQHMSVVFQDVFLFEGTILENICFGTENTDFEQAQSAAQKACCHDFIMALPQGYNTQLGENGAQLSGGQRQRLSVARAIMKDAPIIILDEATASIDPENENLLHQALQELTKNKTVITIAHKLHTIRNAQQILVLEQGRIVQCGSHEALKNQEGLYARLIQARQKALQWTL